MAAAFSICWRRALARSTSLRGKPPSGLTTMTEARICTASMEAARGEHHDGEIVPGVGEMRVELERLDVVRFRFGELVAGAVDGAEIVVRGGVAGGDLHGAPVGLDGRVRLARGEQDVAEIGPDAGVLRRMPGASRSIAAPSRLSPRPCRSTPRNCSASGMIGDGREDAAVDRLRDLGIARLVVGYRHGQRFLERRRMERVAVVGSALLLDRHLCHRPLPVPDAR